jgi:hypothetical protein
MYAERERRTRLLLQKAAGRIRQKRHPAVKLGHYPNAMTFLQLVERLRAGRKTMPVARRRAAD